MRGAKPVRGGRRSDRVAAKMFRQQARGEGPDTKYGAMVLLTPCPKCTAKAGDYCHEDGHADRPLEGPHWQRARLAQRKPGKDLQGRMKGDLP